MFAAQQLFQLFIVLFQLAAWTNSRRPFRLLLRSTAKPEYQTDPGCASGWGKYFVESGMAADRAEATRLGIATYSHGMNELRLGEPGVSVGGGNLS
jgi:hypothetical protein